MTLDKTQIPKFVYIGQGGPLSIIPLKKLCDKGFRPEAVIVADKSKQPKGLNLLPVKPPRLADNLAGVADELGLPLIYWQKGCEAEIAANLADISADLVIMSCFPWRIPEMLLVIPKQGWWNLHPSPLPAYRGPTPIFWQAKAGESHIGVSLHQVTTNLDSGAIIGKQTVSALDLQRHELEVELAQQGAKLVEQGLWALGKDQLQPQPQQERDASYQGFPNQQDRCIERTGTASAAYRFIALVNSVYPLCFKLDGKEYTVSAALGFNDEGVLGVPYRVEDNQIAIQFEQGVLTVAYSFAAHP